MIDFLLSPMVTLGWPISYIEVIILAFNIASVYLASRNSSLNYSVGLVGIFTYMWLCYVLAFYSEFFLQIVFAIMSIVGLIMWRANAGKPLLKITDTTWLQDLVVITVLVAGTAFVGSNIDVIFSTFVSMLILPIMDVITGTTHEYIHVPASYPYIDAFTSTAQVVAMWLMVKRKIQCWYLWITIDVVSIPMFALKGGYGISVMFMVFLGLASYGLYNWRKLKAVQ